MFSSSPSLVVLEPLILERLSAMVVHFPSAAFVEQHKAFVLFPTEILALALGQFARLGRQIAGIDGGHGEPGKLRVIERVGAAGLDAILDAQESVATERGQSLRDHALAALLACFLLSPEAARQRRTG
jgi:hypothetical protein